MQHIPSIDYSCARCGATQIYQLVPMATPEQGQRPSTGPGAIPSLDLSCSRCGATQTYQLVPASVAADAG